MQDAGRMIKFTSPVCRAGNIVYCMRRKGRLGAIFQCQTGVHVTCTRARVLHRAYCTSGRLSTWHLGRAKVNITISSRSSPPQQQPQPAAAAAAEGCGGHRDSWQQCRAVGHWAAWVFLSHCRLPSCFVSRSFPQLCVCACVLGDGEEVQCKKAQYV